MRNYVPIFPMRLRSSLLVVTLTVFLASCETMDKKTIGAITGGVIGAGVGTQVGGGRGKILAVIAGAAAGAYVGSKVGGHLEERDRKKMAEATQKTAETSQPQTFSNPDTGVQGKAEVVKTETHAVKVSEQNVENRECKTIRQTIVTKDNREVKEDVTTCKGPNGWEPVA
jgi:surface antigen